ncbi:MAG: hypothetical protein HY231_10695 [Acidobacteria bacterium]|nr:hypothetical protein [Acidobacteriota bacterium]
MPRTAWNKRLTPEMEQLIIAHYQEGHTAREVLKLIPFKTKKTVYDVLEKHGVAKRSPYGRADYKSYHEAIFANVDTQAKAYWLGILLTDGYISDTRNNGEPQIGLQMIDCELLEKFREFLGSTNPVLHIKARSIRHQPLYRVTVSSQRMAADLSRYGVVPRKSALTYLPVLQQEFMPHLLRGILDGDGTVSHRQDGGAIIGFCGSERLLTEIRMWLICKLGISDNRLHQNKSVAFIQWSLDADIRKITRYLYQNAEVYLERKKVLLKRYL